MSRLGATRRDHATRGRSDAAAWAVIEVLPANPVITAGPCRTDYGRSARAVVTLPTYDLPTQNCTYTVHKTVCSESTNSTGKPASDAEPEAAPPLWLQLGQRKLP